MNHFEGFTEEQKIKIRYRELAKTYHPDKGGCVELMKEVNAQYIMSLESSYQLLGKSITEVEELLQNDEILMAKLAEIILCEEIEIELCGKWIWVTGNTRLVKDKLKEAKFFWASAKKAWYWRSEKDRSYNRRKMEMDEIRYKHGTIAVKPKAYKEKIA